MLTVALILFAVIIVAMIIQPESIRTWNPPWRRDDDE